MAKLPKNKIVFVGDILDVSNEFGSQLHEDFPSEKAIDSLTVEQMKAIWLNAPVGYFHVSSKLADYFEEKLEKAGVFTKEFERQVETIYLNNLKGMKNA